ncbi:methylenetetrahydrofolate--tRNA-(uracil(54)-C(5))-methyltransferase (FADH(2)-oxidizing) TrmFO [Desulfovibrio piger]|nr:methylenetetrahydrofolate--tRNA-(uracil(54)-C(5))-methyltransferase (FADH(2)-oxidizing) TrmFO [Desulfovibrio piger]
MNEASLAVVGGGLAGCECALRLADAGLSVVLFEQKPEHRSPAHVSDRLAELVCSNSLRSDDIASGIGLLKAELRSLGSAFMACADATRVPAGKALAVDREAFAEAMTRRILEHPRISLRHRRIDSLDDPELASMETVVIAAGPVASDGLSASLADVVGERHCYFYDAIAPIVWTHSLNQDIVFRASRYGQEKGEEGGDYLNCPMNKDEYMAFYEALLGAEKVAAHDFEKEKHFEGCMPIEALAERGPKTLTFGPLKPVGFEDPRTGRRPWAVLQLRAENANADACNLVGCQTKLTYAEQARIFRMVPGLEQAEFARFGSMHRNTYVNAPQALTEDLRLVARPRFLLAGQITGMEGYVESAACGLWAALLLEAQAQGRNLPAPPPTTALGALLQHLRTPVKRFQPSNAHFGLMPELAERAKKQDRKALYSARAQADFAQWKAENFPGDGTD